MNGIVTAKNIIQLANHLSGNTNATEIADAIQAIPKEHQEFFFAHLDRAINFLSNDAKSGLAKAQLDLDQNNPWRARLDLWKNLGTSSDIMPAELQRRAAQTGISEAAEASYQALSKLEGLPQEAPNASKSESVLAISQLLTDHIDLHLDSLDDPNAIKEATEQLCKKLVDNEEGLYSQDALGTVLEQIQNNLGDVSHTEALLKHQSTLFKIISGPRDENWAEIPQYIQFNDLTNNPEEAVTNLEPEKRKKAQENIENLLHKFKFNFVQKHGTNKRFEQLSTADQKELIAGLQEDIDKLSQEEKALLKVESEKTLELIKSQKDFSFGSIVKNFKAKSIFANFILASMAGAALGPLGFLAVGAIGLLGATAGKKEPPGASSVVEFDNSNTESSQEEKAQKLAP